MKNKKIREYLKNENLIIIVIIIAVSIFAFYIKTGISDELWNFSNIYKMTNGEVIYKDCNIIITPLFFYIGEILFKVLVANYLIFRFYNLAIFSILYFLIYKIFRKINIERKNAIVYLFIIFIITCKIILVGANYNTLAIIFVLLGILMILKNNNPITQGIIIFLIFMTKQTIGVYYCLGIITYNFITNENIKTKIIKNAKTIGIFIFLFLLYCIYLIVNQNFYNFINYTVLGLLDFNQNTIYDNYIILFSVETIFIIYIFFMTLLAKNRKENEDHDRNVIIILSIFSIVVLLNSYPIFNKGHILISSFLPFILFAYILNKFITKIRLVNKKTNKIIDILENIFIVGGILCSIVASIYFNYLYITSFNKVYEPYYGGIIENTESIDLIIEYIEQEEANQIDVKILSCDANLYNNILKRNNGNIDLPFYGNLGYNGIENLISSIKNMKNTNILISKDGVKFQEVKEVIDFVINNYEKIGEIGEYYIYKVGY